MVDNRRTESDGDLSFGLLVVVTFAACFMLAEVRIVVTVISVYAVFVFPGVLYFSRRGLSNIDSVLYGVPLGLCTSGLIVITSAAVTKWNLGTLIAAYVISLSALALGRSGKVEVPIEENHDHKDHSIPQSVFALIFVFVLLVFIPLFLAGRLTPNGYAFTGLFGHDFILRGHYAVALARAVPPENFFFDGQLVKNYYLLWYTLPATVYKLLGMSGDIRKIVSIICMLNVPIFFLLLFRSLAAFIRDNHHSLIDSRKKKVLIFSFGVILFSYSYHWVFFFFKKAVDSWGIGWLSHYTDQMGFLSQSWFRDFLFDPQLVLALMMMLLIIRIMREKNSWSRGLLVGIILSGIALSDLPAFFMFSSAYFLFMGWMFIRKRETIILVDVVASAVTGLVIAGVMVLMGIFSLQEYSNSIIIRPYLAVIVLSPVFLMLHFGGTAITGVLGMIRKVREDDHVFMLFLTATSLLFMFFVTEVLDGNAFLRKSIQIIRLPIVLFTGYYLARVSARRWLAAIIVLLVIAVPTVFTDVYAVTRGGVAGETTYIRPAEMEAAFWLRDHTADTSVVQSLIDYPGGRFSYSLTVCFGERKAALAHWKIAYLLYPNVDAIRKRVQQIEAIFMTKDDDKRYAAARDLRINYILISDKERRYFPGCESRVSRDTRRFKRVFGNEEVRIYEVLDVSANNT